MPFQNDDPDNLKIMIYTHLNLNSVVLRSTSSMLMQDTSNQVNSNLNRGLKCMKATNSTAEALTIKFKRLQLTKH